MIIIFQGAVSIRTKAKVQLTGNGFMLLVLTSLFGGMNVTDSCLNIDLSKLFLA